jgi:hypothetical protein
MLVVVLLFCGDRSLPMACPLPPVSESLLSVGAPFGRLPPRGTGLSVLIVMILRVGRSGGVNNGTFPVPPLLFADVVTRAAVVGDDDGGPLSSGDDPGERLRGLPLGATETGSVAVVAIVVVAILIIVVVALGRGESSEVIAGVADVRLLLRVLVVITLVVVVLVGPCNKLIITL